MVTDYPEWIDDLRIRRSGESAGEHIARIVRGCEGLSLDHDGDKLADLFLINEATHDRAHLVASLQTNCATFYRQCLALAGCIDPHVLDPYVVGEAMADDQEAAHQLGAVRSFRGWGVLRPGWGMLYYGTGNDAHIEVCLGTPNMNGECAHGGGGRARNAITIELSTSILSSRGRPLRALFDPEALCLLPATGDDPY